MGKKASTEPHRFPLISAWGSAKARNRLIVMAVIGAGAGVLSGALGSWRYAPLIGWDVAATSFSASAWMVLAGMDAQATEEHARNEDPTRPVTDGLLLTASLASLIAVGVVLVAANSTPGSDKGLLAGLGAFSVAVSWLLVHTLFTLRYARIYHSAGGGVDFNQKDPPRYVDFAYLAFTIGMTFQVSDTNLTSPAIRATALRHALLSYLFGAVILATAVNFIVSLSSS
jgi:uncharacterized membrane protein